MEVATVSVIDAFIAELACIYDTEYRVCAMVSNLVSRCPSKALRTKLLKYVDGSGLAQGKLEMLFHMMGSKIRCKESVVVAYIIEECMKPVLPGIDRDLAATHHIKDILDFKICCYQTLIGLSKQLDCKSVTAVVHELHDYEVKFLSEFIGKPAHSGNGQGRRSSM